MNMKKLTAIAAAAIMAAGTCTGVPAGTGNSSPLAITAEAADSDFLIGLDDDGDKYIMAYKGKGGAVKIPSDIYWIDEEAFAGNKTITSITLPKNCTYIGANAFAECTSLKKFVTEGDIIFGPTAFDYCINLESVTVKGSVSAIYSGAFYGCQSLKTVKIEKDEYEFSIGGSAFQNCFSLTSINIPSKCKEIYTDAFINCFSLTKLTIPAKTKINTDEGGYNFGYAYLLKSASDAEKALSGKDVPRNTFVADGKTKGYEISYSFTNGDFVSNIKQYTPKAITLTVTKGSPAEKWAKANKVKYTYASGSSSSGSAAAPANIKASKTNNSVTLSWDKADGAAMYRVYKYNDKTGKYEKYKDVTSAKCTVSGLSANTKYKFMVVSYSKANGKYVKGESSKAVSVTTKK